MRLGLRFNNKVDESQDVTPGSLLRRKQVAWSLYRATTLEDWVVDSLEERLARTGSVPLHGARPPTPAAEADPVTAFSRHTRR